MHQVNMHEAKSQLSRLVDEAQAGQDVVIARAGKPVARLIPYETVVEARRPGRWKGEVELSEDFDDTPQDLIDAFEGNE